jgi:acetylornithine aminotransferase
MGQRLMDGLRSALAGNTGVKDIRGQGLMVGVELARPCGALLGQAAEAGLLISVTADSVIRLVPALNISAAEIDEIIAKLVPLVKNFLQST